MKGFADSVAKQMKDYANGLYENWVRDVNDNTIDHLKAPIQAPKGPMAANDFPHHSGGGSS